MVWGISDADEGKPDLEEIVNGSMGDSVTPSKLTQSSGLWRVAKWFGEKPVEGPFHTYLNSDEQLHYIFNGNTSLEFPDNNDPFDDGLEKTLGTLGVEPVIGMFSDKRIILVYEFEDSHRVIPIPYNEINDILHDSYLIGHDLIISTSDREYLFSVVKGTDYISEFSDAVSYIGYQTGLDPYSPGLSFGSGDYSSAQDTLHNHLSKILKNTDKIDIKYIAICGAKGAKIGTLRGGGYVTGLCFMLGAGYGIWSELYDSDMNPPDVEDIDPKEAASTIARWQRAGEEMSGKRASLATGALGAALTIDKQTSGRRVSELLADLDVDAISRQLVEGNSEEAGIQVASGVVEEYSEDLADILDEDFFSNIPRE